MVRNITSNNGFAPKYSKLIPSTWIGLVSNVFLLNPGADTGGWRGDIRHPLTDTGRGVAPP